MVSSNTGTLGRLADALSTDYHVNAFSVDTNLVALEGHPQTHVPKTAVNSDIGFQRFNPSVLKGESDAVNEQFAWINGEQESRSNPFGQTWSSSLVSAKM